MLSVSVDRGLPASGMVDQIMRSRSEGVIAGGRLAISFFVLGAVWLDPSQPTELPRVTYTLLVLYVALSTLLFYTRRITALSPRRLGLPARTVDIAIHVTEMSLFAFLLYATDGLTSPFFPLFTFSILTGTFRWGWRGALWTSVAVLVLVIISALVQIKFLPIAEVDIDRFLIRCAHAGVIGAMLTYFAFHQQRAEGEVLRLGTWVPEPSDLLHISDYLSSCARFTAEVFATSRIVVVAQNRHESQAFYVCYDSGEVRQERLSASEHEIFAPAPGEYVSLSSCADPEVLVLPPGGDVRSAPVPEQLRKLCTRLNASHLLSVPIQTELFVGRLLVLDRPDFSLSEMIAASLAARQIESGLIRIAEIDALRRAAASEERLRMGRDLHDGVLQTLAATAMHLEAIRRSPSEDKLAMAALQDWLIKEQRELRHLIERLRSGSPAEPNERDTDDAADLHDIVESVEQRWGIPIELSYSPPELSLGAELTFQVQQIVREAAANAVRHGGASTLSLTLLARDDGLEIQIADNGSGLGQHGVFDAQQCADLQLGSRNLRERVAVLGGSFRLHSRPEGLQINISLPFRRSS